jgi:glycosyltransferase involved in cell wall biosynthesis
MSAGGIETLLMTLYRTIDREELQFDFLVHRESKGFYDDEIKNLGGKIYIVPALSANPIKYFIYLKKIKLFFKFCRNQYKIIHVHTGPFGVFVLRAAQKVGINIRIMHSHMAPNNIDFKRIFREIVKIFIKRYATHFFACSKKAGVYMFGKKCEEDTRYYYFRNAIQTDKFTFNQDIRNEYRTGMNLERKFVVMHTGRFFYVKNHSFLIDIFFNLVKLHSNAILLLVGEDGPLKQNIEQKVSLLGLNDHVIFLGVRNDIQNLLQGADVFIFPSKYEGLPIAVIEAQAAGLPVFISDRISEEIKLTDLVTVISLEIDANDWAKIILEKTSQIKRKNTYNEIVAKGYDSTESCKWLTNFYLQQIDTAINK